MDFEPKRVRGRAFRNERVEIDGTEFLDCTFDNCQLIYRGGKPFFLGGPGQNTAQIIFEDGAMDVLNTLCTMYRFGMANVVERIFDNIRDPAGAEGRGGRPS